MTAAVNDSRKIGKRWQALLRLIPGYDPFVTSGDSWFEPELANRAIGFFADVLQHVEGDVAGKPFALEPWQQAFIGNLFGWVREDDQGRTVRRYRETLLYIPRKNGKTPLAAGICLYGLFCDNEPGAQIYTAAAEKEQASLIYRHAKGMVEREPELASRCTIYKAVRSLMLKDDPAATYKVLSADADTKHGGNTHIAVVDELHTQPNRELVDVLQTSTASEGRRQPLMVYLTTADYDRPSICNEKYDYASKVRDGIINDPAFLPVVYEAGQEEDWTDPAVWRRVNPNLGVSVSMAYLERECQKAKENVAYENTFRRLHLNQRTGQVERVIPVDKWDACRRAEMPGKVPPPQPHQQVFVAVDIGATSDFTAEAQLFPHDDAEEIKVADDPEKPDAVRSIVRRSYTLRPHFWLPERPVRRDPRMEATIDGWRRAGFITTTPGDVVDYDMVFEDILRHNAGLDVAEIAFDRGFQGVRMEQLLLKHFGEKKVVSFPQGILSLNAPFRELLELIILGRIHHDNDPVMRWMVSNTAAERRGGLMKPSKEKSTEKIDGVTALVMALGRAMLKKDTAWYKPGMLRD